MHIDNIIVKFEKLAKSISNLADEIKQYKKESIKWSIEDFVEMAYRLERDNETSKTYDPTKFQKALELMISNHDAETGITWEILQFYLDEHCLKE